MTQGAGGFAEIGADTLTPKRRRGLSMIIAWYEARKSASLSNRGTSNYQVPGSSVVAYPYVF